MIFRRTLLYIAVGIWGIIWLHTPSLTLPALVIVLVGVPLFMILRYAVLPIVLFVISPALRVGSYIYNNVSFELFWIGLFWTSPIPLAAGYYIYCGYTALFG